MATTVYSRIVKYCIDNDRVLVTPQHRKKIGYMCVNKWKSYYKGQEPFPTQKVNISEDGYNYNVVEYPNKFIRHIDDCIRRYYTEILPKRSEKSQPTKTTIIPEKKERKRIPIPKKPEKVFSFNK